MANTSLTIDLPQTVFDLLEDAARQQQRSVSDIARDLILRELPDLPALPADVEAELAAFDYLSDDVLWLLARSTLSQAEQQALAALNDKAQREPLTPDEESRQQQLIAAYDRLLVRRARAAALLQSRGYDLSDPAILKAA